MAAFGLTLHPHAPQEAGPRIVCTGELDAFGAGRLGQVVRDVLNKGTVASITVDLTPACPVEPAAAVVLANIHAECRARGADITFLGTDPQAAILHGIPLLVAGSPPQP